MSFRHEGPREKPIPVIDLIAERERRRDPSASELAARNQADVMVSLVFPNLAASLTDEEAEQLVAADLEEARAKLMEAMKTADRDGLGGLHMRVACLLADVDQLRVDMAGGSAA